MVQQPLLPHQPAMGRRRIVHPRHPHVRSADGVGLLPQSRHHQPVRLHDAARRGRLHVSTREQLAGLRVVRRNADGSLAQAHGGTPAVTEKSKGKLLVEWPMDDGRKLTILLSEEGMEIAVSGKGPDWMLELTAAPGAALPFTAFGARRIAAVQKRVRLRIRLYEGHHCDRRHLHGKHIRPASFRRKDLAEIQITAQRFHKPAACLGIGAGRQCLKPFRECGIPANFR